MTLDPALLPIMRVAAKGSAPDFIRDHVMTGEPYVYRGDAPRYNAFREEIAGKLSVHETAIRLVGSAKLGFSLSQDHLLRPFSRESDLDIVVVEPELFDAAMLELRERSKDIRMAGQDERSRLRH